MTKSKQPREFWILGYDHISGSSIAYEEKSKAFDAALKDNTIHVREVVSVDWDKVWAEYKLTKGTYNFDWYAIQQLVERALKGEL